MDKKSLNIALKTEYDFVVVQMAKNQCAHTAIFHLNINAQTLKDECIVIHVKKSKDNLSVCHLQMHPCIG